MWASDHPQTSLGVVPGEGALRRSVWGWHPARSHNERFRELDRLEIDVINGFSSAQGDIIRLQNIAGFTSFADVTNNATLVSGDTVIDLGGGNSLTLSGVDFNTDLSAADFLFG